MTVQTIDLNFQGVAGVIASSVFDTGDGLAVVDTGPGSTLDALETGLAGLGATLSDVRHVLLTHIHFDHAGAAGTVLERVPQARAYVHERGAAHLSRPERLLASATQIYGEHMDTLWGAMQPIDPQRLTVLSGGETLTLGNQAVRVLYTPGHAVHHVAYHAGDDLFLGDVGGIRLDAAQTPRAPTPPPDINLDAWRDSLSTLETLDARTLHLAHFGAYPNTPAHWAGLRATMTADAERIRAGLEAGHTPEAITDAFTEDLMHELKLEDPTLPARYDFACPPWMSVQGLIRYWQRRAARGTA
ncbi:MBL fold metallo-hydrolase [Deinococcus radiotolerans]|uniref:MBL fold hydrolase n=1 Tax=Deinococcus radiotolerans TaxID=1309407 RepID=A0ABQ2FEG4_9DEIO|nr:MBL fold metallo-hydrolase [Deinococcus radiotolerans]GGK87911.1 MBL fold hydrolase [Deinococcus radiotolerans]